MNRDQPSNPYLENAIEYTINIALRTNPLIIKDMRHIEIEIMADNDFYSQRLQVYLQFFSTPV